MLRAWCFITPPLQINERGLCAAPITIYDYTGSFFVDVFFIISGFLICSILEKESSAGRFSLKNFYLRRILRIWPLCFLVVLLTLVVAPALRHVPAEIIKTNTLYALGFAVNFQLIADEAAKTYSILWSVCIEEHIYLLLPFLLLLFRKHIGATAVFLVIAGFGGWLLLGSVAYYASSSYFYYFGVGGLLGVIQKKLIAEKMAWLFSKPVQLLVFAMAVVYVFNFLSEASYHRIVWLIVSGALGAHLVASATRPTSVLIIKESRARFFGNISYAVYLVHVFVINWILLYVAKRTPVVSVAAATLWIPLVATLTGSVLAALLYYLYERHFLRLKGKFATIQNK